MPDPASEDHIETHIGADARNVAVGKQITQINAETVYVQGDEATPAAPIDWAAAEARYRAQIVTHYNRLTLTGLPERDPNLHEITLDNIFVKLNVQLPQPAREYFWKLEDALTPIGEQSANERFASLAQDQRRAARRMREHPIVQERPPEPITLSVAQALQRYQRMVILGGPGSGKTTLTRWLAVVFARSEQAQADKLGADFGQDRLPVLLELRRFTDHLHAASPPGPVPHLGAAIATYISQHAYYTGTPAALIQQALAQGRCLLICDGLDEIADPALRRTLGEAIQALCQHPDQHYRDNLLVVTSRPYGYRDVALGGAFQRCEVKEFSPEDVKHFVRAWYATAYGSGEHAEAQELIDAIAANERVGELAANPLLCTIIAIVYRNNRVLPNRRVELYLKCCEALLDTWERNKAIKDSGLVGGYDWQTKLELLAPVAWWLHSETERLAAPEAAFVEQLAAVLRARKLGDPAQAEQEARRFIQVIRDRSGLLQGRGDGSLEFMHRTFQEYLAARHIAAQPYPDYIDLVMADLHLAWGQEVHLLVMGYLGSNSATAEKASRLLITILDSYRPPLSILVPAWSEISYLAWSPISTADKTWYKFLLESLNMSMGVASFFLDLLLDHLAMQFSPLQLPQRLAWILNREFELAANAYLDCAPLGVGQEVRKYLEVRIKKIVQVFFDRQDFRLLSPSLIPIIHQLSRHLDVNSLVSELLRMTKSEYWLSRAKSIMMLGTICEANFLVEILRDRQSDPNAAVRFAIVIVLGQASPHDSAVLELLINATGDMEPEIQRAAIEALGFPDAPLQVITLLVGILDGGEDSLRSVAVNSLGTISSANSLVKESLLRSLKDKDSSVRAAAINAIANMRNLDRVIAVDSLFLALNDDDPYVWHICSTNFRGHGSDQFTDSRASGPTSNERRRISQTCGHRCSRSNGTS